MKTKNRKVSGYHGFPKPKKVKCFQCDKVFYVKFVIARLDYSRKNNWGFWTEQEENQNQEWCNPCLRKIYQDKFTYWKAVTSTKKRNLFRVYLHKGNI